MGCKLGEQIAKQLFQTFITPIDREDIHAINMAAVLNLVGAFIGTHVASTIGKGIVNADIIAGQMVIAWVLTLPASAFAGMICFYIINLLFG